MTRTATTRFQAIAIEINCFCCSYWINAKETVVKLEAMRGRLARVQVHFSQEQENPTVLAKFTFRCPSLFYFETQIINVVLLLAHISLVIQTRYF